MQTVHAHWGGHDLIHLTGEATAGGSPKTQAIAMFGEVAATLADLGSGLTDIVRTRLWARDARARDEGCHVRYSTLVDGARSASSSYVCPARFATPAAVAIDVVAIPGASELGKRVVERDPPAVPLRYLTLGNLVIMSGVTTVLPSLADQVAANLERISDMLVETSSDWQGALEMRSFLHRSQERMALEGLLSSSALGGPPPIIEFVDGYSAPGKLVEFEVTATRTTSGERR